LSNGNISCFISTFLPLLEQPNFKTLILLKNPLKPALKHNIEFPVHIVEKVIWLKPILLDPSYLLKNILRSYTPAEINRVIQRHKEYFTQTYDTKIKELLSATQLDRDPFNLKQRVLEFDESACTHLGELCKKHNDKLAKQWFDLGLEWGAQIIETSSSDDEGIFVIPEQKMEV
jgi:hypothetical protein